MYCVPIPSLISTADKGHADENHYNAHPLVWKRLLFCMGGEQNLKAFLSGFSDQEEAIQNLFVFLNLTESEETQRILRDVLKQEGCIRGTIPFYSILLYSISSSILLFYPAFVHLLFSFYSPFFYVIRLLFYSTSLFSSYYPFLQYPLYCPVASHYLQCRYR